jgi:hypothetical protein
MFTGANIHIVSDATVTNDNSTGLGNLIIGYNELPTGGSIAMRGGSAFSPSHVTSPPSPAASWYRIL